MDQMDLSELSMPETGAAYWDARLRSPECTDAERVAFTEWRDANPANRAAFETLQSVLHQLREARHRPELRAIRDAALGHVQPRRRRAGFLSGALAASLIAVMAAGLWFGRELFSPAVSARHLIVETDVGEHRELTLPDGSTVSVGARSRMSVQFTDKTRSVQMDEGEAYFTVAHDDTRPFVVRAGAGTITAIGTAFNVQHIAGRVVVTVVEGGVDVASIPPTPVIGKPPAASASPREAAYAVTRVQAGEQLVYGEVFAPVRAADPAMAVAWRTGHLQYLGEPLKFVIPDVERYTRKRLVIADEGVGRLNFTGTVFQDDVDDWLKGLETSLPVEVVAVDDNTVVIKARTPTR